ncbi:hypothetical protein Tco_0072953 [Tanacetum coccineum]
MRQRSNKRGRQLPKMNNRLHILRLLELARQTQEKEWAKRKKAAIPRQFKGIRFNKPKSTLVYRAVTKSTPPKENNSEKNGAKKKHINDDLDFMELKNSFDKLRHEDSIFEVVEDPKMVMGTGSSLDVNNEHMSLNSDLMKAQGLVSGKDNKEADVASSSKLKFSFGPLELGDISDSDEDEVFASQEDFNAYMSSTRGGH